MFIKAKVINPINKAGTNYTSSKVTRVLFFRICCYALHSLAYVAGSPRRFRWNVCLGTILDFGRGETEQERKSDVGEGSWGRFYNISVAKSSPLPSPWSRLYVERQLHKLYTPTWYIFIPSPYSEGTKRDAISILVGVPGRQTDHHHQACARRRRCVATWPPMLKETRVYRKFT